MAQDTAGGAGGSGAGPPAAARGGAAPVRAAGASAPAPAEGMEVVDSAGVYLGRVKAVRRDDFLLARELQRDVYVPMEYVQSVAGGRVALTLSTADVSALKLETPPLL